MQSLALYVGFGLVTASILCIGAVGFTQLLSSAQTVRRPTANVRSSPPQPCAAAS